MTDAFAELGVPRRPHVDRTLVESNFRERAAACHPDRNGGDPSALARLNAARKTLSSEAARLKHLLAIAFPTFAPQTRFSPDFEMFSLVGTLARSAEALATKRESASSALAAALLEKESVALQDSVREAARVLGARRDEVSEQLLALDAKWPDIPAEELAGLAENAAFCERWSESLRLARLRLLGG